MTAPVRGIDTQLPAPGGPPRTTSAAEHHDAVVGRKRHRQIGIRHDDDLVDRIRLVENGSHRPVQGRPGQGGNHDAHAGCHESGATATDRRKCAAQ